MIFLVLFIALVAGCFYEQLSWSPDGRYLAYAAGDRGSLWRWDSVTRQCEKIEFSEKAGWEGTTAINGPVRSCRYLAHNSILFLTETEKEHGELFLADLDGKHCKSIAKTNGPAFDVSSKGRVYYRGPDPDLAGVVSLIEYSGGPDGTARTLLTQADNVTFMRSDPDGDRLAYCDEAGLHIFDLATSATSLVLSGNDDKYYWPTWVDDERLLVIDKTQDNYGDLLEIKIPGGAKRNLASGVALATAFTLNPGGRTVAFASRPDPKSDTDQIAAMDVESGRMVWLTKELLGAGAPSYSPDGGTLAYLQSVPSTGDGLEMLKLLDVASGRVEVAWRNDEERLYAEADTLAQGGHPAQAMAVFQDLRQRFPQSPLLLAAQFQEMLIYLEKPLLNLDKAFECWSEISRKVDTQEMPPEIAKWFWHSGDRVAEDPAGDWITAFNTPESAKAFNGANTDQARDLAALWFRSGEEKIYLRIDFADSAGLDPSGVALLDTLILIGDANTSDTTATAIGPHARWSHAAKRQVLIRHWAQGGEGSQYDLEVRDENGEIIHRFLASGFAPPRDPLFDRPGFVVTGESSGSSAGRTRGAIYAISRSLLGLRGKHKINLQVVTLKGGIDPRGATELPPDTGCGVADAFGPENAPAKVKARTRPGEPAVIESQAAVLELK